MRRVVLFIAPVLLVACAASPTPTTPTPPPAPAYTGPPWYAVPATPEQVAFAQEKAAYDLKDPSSAQFRNLYAISRGLGDDAVCGEINAKNSYGAYVGFRKFYVRHGGSVQIADPTDSVMGALPAIVCNKPPKP